MLRVEGLSKAFGAVQAVQDMGFTAARGEITALIGPNGAGKTTTFNMITGFLKSDSGRVSFEGADVTARGPHAVARLGCVRTFQGVEAFGGMSVLENVMIGASALWCHGIVPALLKTPSYRRREREAKARSLECLEAVGLAHLSDERARRLGFGQLRLMEIARALAASPKILLLDEPGSGLNSREVEDLISLLLGLNAKGITILVIDHDMQLIMSVAKTIVVMDKGRKIAAGSPAAVRGDPAVIEAYLGG